MTAYLTFNWTLSTESEVEVERILDRFIMIQSIKIYKNQQVKIEERVVKCEKDMFLLSQISRMWIGKLPIPKISIIASLAILILALIGMYYINIIAVIFVLFVSMMYFIFKAYTQSKHMGLIIELDSGTQYCFYSDGLHIIQKAYELINNIINDKNDEYSYWINFGENEEIINLQEIKEKNTLTEDIQSLTIGSSPLRQELQKLMVHYKNNDEGNVQIIAFLGQIARDMDANNTSELKELYGKFIQSCLIGDCNELGLYLLINEVKKSVF